MVKQDLTPLLFFVKGGVEKQMFEILLVVKKTGQTLLDIVFRI